MMFEGFSSYQEYLQQPGMLRCGEGSLHYHLEPDPHDRIAHWARVLYFNLAVAGMLSANQS